MELKEYIKQSERTMIDKGFSMNMLHASLGIVTETAELLDAYKKHIFYGKPLDLINIQEEIGDIFWYLAIFLRDDKIDLNEILNLDDLLKSKEIDLFIRELNLTHILLKLSEYSFEIHKNLNNLFLFSINDLDRHIRSTEDIKSYTENLHFKIYARLKHFLIITLALIKYFKLDIKDILQTNINKLAKRYPEKFTEENALNRDLKAEREVLEGLNTKTEQESYSLNFFLTDGVNNYPVDNSGIDNRVPKVGE